jgi:hypothetical protein
MMLSITLSHTRRRLLEKRTAALQAIYCCTPLMTIAENSSHFDSIALFYFTIYFTPRRSRHLKKRLVLHVPSLLLIYFRRIDAKLLCLEYDFILSHY